MAFRSAELKDAVETLWDIGFNISASDAARLFRYGELADLVSEATWLYEQIQDQQQTVDELNSELNWISLDLYRKRHELSYWYGERDNAAEQIQEIEDEIRELEQEQRELREEIEDTQDEIEDLERQKEDLEDKIAYYMAQRDQYDYCTTWWHFYDSYVQYYETELGEVEEDLFWARVHLAYLEDQYSENEEKIEELLDEQAEYWELYSEADRNIRRLEREIEDLEEEYDQVAGEYSSAVDELRYLQEQGRNYKPAISDPSHPCVAPRLPASIATEASGGSTHPAPPMPHARGGAGCDPPPLPGMASA